MNYCNKRRSESAESSFSIIPSSKKWQRLDESSMFGNKKGAELTTEASNSSSSSSFSEGDDEPVVTNLSCGEAAAAAESSSSSLSIIDNIFPTSSVPPQNLIKQQSHAQSNNNEAAAAHPQETTTSIAPSSSTMAAAAALRCNKKSMVQSPNDFFTAKLRSRGYPATTFCSLKGGYHSTPTTHQTSSYGISLTRAIRSSDKPQVQTLLSTGLNPNACNKFGESIIHAVCRRGDHDMLRILLDAGSSVQVSDDFGRTPLHDACWTASPNFETISLLLEKDPWLLSITDCRGSTPLGYVRKAHWAVWNGFLGAIIDRYWPPCRIDDGIIDARGCIASDIVKREQDSDHQEQENGTASPKIPPLSLLEPDSSPVIDPPQGRIKCLDLLELLANGKIDPQDLDKKNADTIMKDRLKEVEVNRRITFDPLRTNGLNATVMKGSGSKIAQGYVRVSTPV
mmetsp:Transcript_4909/g.7634  ORF Transcript_4909/g.7634 Transcript_4909/m.7634 type:complete len:453 (+) Transcript_4909:338-1696(+)